MKIRKALRNFDVYGWETPTYEIAEKTGLPVEKIVRLDTNTSPFKPKSALALAARRLEKLEVNQYPDTSYHDLRTAISKYTGKGIDRFVITNGADEGLDIMTKVLIDEGDEVILPTPTYSMYRIASQIMGAKVRTVPRRGGDFGLDVEAILERVNSRTKIIFVCNPNNPTGNHTPEAEIETLAKRSGVVVAVDEAYFEYCGQSALELTDRLENVIVCRTLSKAFSLAGARVGYLVAKRETVDQLNIVRPPNSLTVVSLLLGQAALEDLSEMRKHVAATVSERERLIAEMRQVDGVEPFPSVTNFVLFRLRTQEEAEKVHARLMGKGLVLRNPAGVKGIEGCLRTTVGTPEVNDRLLAELASAVGR